jgi:hypothetical protein
MDNFLCHIFDDFRLRIASRSVIPANVQRIWPTNQKFPRFCRYVQDSFHPECQEKSCFEQGWGFHEVSHTASMKDGGRKKFT